MACCLVFRNTPVLDEAALAWLRMVSQVSLNPRQKRILAYARVHGGIFSSSDYQKFGVDRMEPTWKLRPWFARAWWSL